MEPRKEEIVKGLLSGKVGLALVCYYLQHDRTKIKLKDISKYVDVDLDELKKVGKALEAEKVAKLHHTFCGVELEFDSKHEEKIRSLINEIIWKKKEEYGEIYKRITTAESKGFMLENTQNGNTETEE
ncbi:MAG: hypothetical protein WCJ46_00030 [bacterium]